MTSLEDKFNIINNNNNNDTINIIKEYFINYINSNNKILLFEYIQQMLWNNKYTNKIKIDLYNIILITIKTYLIQEKNNIKKKFYEDMYSIDELIDFINNYINKILNINNILLINRFDGKILITNEFSENIDSNKIYNYIDNLNLLINNFVDICYTYLSNYIMNDYNILLVIEKEINNKLNNSNKIKILLELLYKSTIHDNFKLFNNLKKNLSLIYIKDIINYCNNNEYDLPDNLKLINKFINSINYYKYIKNNYKWNIDYCIYYTINHNIIEYIFTIFIDIIKLNSLEEINFIFKNRFNIIIEIYNNQFNNRDEITYLINNEIINLIKKIDNTDLENIILIINIIKYFNIFFIKMYKNIAIHNINKLLDITNLNIIFNKINNYIIDNNYNDVNNIIILLSYIEDKEFICNLYYKNLISRLFTYLINKNNFDINILLEKKLLNILKISIDNKYLYKIKKVIEDADLSYLTNNELNESNTNLINNLNVLLISYNNWSINYNDGLITVDLLNLNTPLTDYILSYNNHYTKNYNNKKLLWLPQYGEINITYLTQNLIMLPIQFMIVEMFIYKDSIPIDEIMCSKFFSNYSNKFKNDIIYSLILSKLMTNINNNLVLSKNGTFKNNLIDIFMLESQYIKNKINDELIFSYRDITVTNINHILKLKSLKFNDLFDEVKNKIKLFNVDNLLLNSSLDYMINMDYIIYNSDGLYEKIYY